MTWNQPFYTRWTTSNSTGLKHPETQPTALIQTVYGRWHLSAVHVIHRDVRHRHAEISRYIYSHLPASTITIYSTTELNTAQCISPIWHPSSSSPLQQVFTHLQSNRDRDNTDEIASPGCPNNLCGDKPCPSPSTCTTYTRTSPSSTLTTCIPAPTCLGVYRKSKILKLLCMRRLTCVESCSFGTGLTCCSGYCAATKCRPTNPKWPGCAEDFQLCGSDADCCYSGSKCLEGICRRVNNGA